MKLRNLTKRLKKSKTAEQTKYPQRVEDVYKAVMMLTDEDLIESFDLSQEQHENVYGDLIGGFNEGFRPIPILYRAHDEISGLYMRERVFIYKLAELRLAAIEHRDFLDEHFITSKGK